MTEPDSNARPQGPAAHPADTGPERPAPGRDAGDHRARAGHGAPSEVSWDDGQGRQPYENQDPAVPEDPAAADVPEGNRGDASGRNLEDMEKSREKWRDSP